MEITTCSIRISTSGHCDIIDITDKVGALIEENKYIEGNALIFAGGSTAGITTIEYEAGYHKVTFNASNLPSGAYIYRIESSDPSTGSGQSFVQTKKMILLK